MATINPYISFQGNCEDAFNFYKSVFGGEFTYVGRFKDSKENPGNQISAADAEKIMHISLPISKETVLMGCDSPVSFGDKVIAGNNFSVSITAESIEEADRIFNALAVGGKIGVPIGKASWGEYFGMLVDKFGIAWMMSAVL